MKSSDAQTLAALVRGSSELYTGRGLSAVPDGVLAPTGDGWLDALHRTAEAPSARGSELEARPEPVTGSGGGNAQLLAAAHAVAAYWVAASPVATITRAAETLGGGQPVTIRVTHLTPEGGLAAVELQHPDLGALAIEISLSGRTLSVLATVETAHAALAIREGQAALTQKLQGQGITLQTLDVVVLKRGVAPHSKSKRQES